MPPEVPEHAFEPFFTTKSRGTGLGLPLAKRIVEAHGGTIEIDTPPSGGTVVLISLPATASSTYAASQAVRDGSSQGSRASEDPHAAGRKIGLFREAHDRIRSCGHLVAGRIRKAPGENRLHLLTIEHDVTPSAAQEANASARTSAAFPSDRRFGLCFWVCLVRRFREERQ